MVTVRPLGAIEGPLLVLAPVFRDARGLVAETWSARDYRAVGLPDAFAQDNVSCSRRGTLRGMHYQVGAAAQGKLVRVLAGAVFDAVVDLRARSRTFGRWAGRVLSGPDDPALWVPPGFAHGFLALADDTLVTYKSTTPYCPDAERVLRWDDPDVGVAWPLEPAWPAVLSERDATCGVSLGDVEALS